MILQDAINHYVAWRRAHGAKFKTSAAVLQRFSKHVGGNMDCDAVATADILGFLSGNGPLTPYRANKYSTLTGFYRYAISAAMRPIRPFQRRKTNHEHPLRQRLTSIPMTNCGACSTPSTSAGSARTNLMPIPCGHCS